MNKGVLNLSYYAMIGKIDNSILVRVSRTQPRLSVELKQLEGLYPPRLLLEFYKDNKIKWDEYTTRYIDYISSNSKSQKDLEYVQTMLDNGQDVTLICYEKNMPCHRFIIGEVFHQAGYKVRLINSDGIFDYENGSCFKGV